MAPILQAATLIVCAATIAAQQPHDLVIYGGTSAGVVAAVQAERMGKSAVLVEPGRHLGGLSSGGLGWTDSGDKSVIGGLSREFYRRIKRHYDRPEAWRWEQAGQYSRYRENDDAMWTFEPHVAERVFEDWMRASGVEVLRGERLDSADGVQMRGARIIAIRTASGRTIRGKVFLDCTYEGDLLAQAKVTYTVGREPNAKHGETMNGVAARFSKSHRFVENQVSPGRGPVAGRAHMLRR